MPAEGDGTPSVNAEQAFTACRSAAIRPGHNSTGQSRASFQVRHHSGSHLEASSHHSVRSGGYEKPPPPVDPRSGHCFKAGAPPGAGPPGPSLEASQAALPSVALAPDQILSPVLAFASEAPLRHRTVALNLQQSSHRRLLHPVVISAPPCRPPVVRPCPPSCVQQTSPHSSWGRPVSGSWQLVRQVGHLGRRWCSGREDYRPGPSWVGSLQGPAATAGSGWRQNSSQAGRCIWLG